jgi:hypothetical protein
MNTPGHGAARGPLAPKPYDFVPFPASVVRRPLSHGVETVLAGEGYYTGRLTLKLTTLTPLFVASGRYELSEDLGFPSGGVARACYRINGRPAIPASSLKGCVRSIAEAVSPSHVSLSRVDLPDYLRDTRFCRVGEKEKSCPACTLFGTGGNKAHIGLVRFEDALSDGNLVTKNLNLLPLRAPQASGRRIPMAYRDSGGFLKGRKFYYHSMPIENSAGDPCEVIPEEAHLSSAVAFMNLEGPLLGLLLFSLSLDDSFKLKLGGGKPLGLGSLSAKATELSLLSQGFLIGAQESERKVEASLSEFAANMIKQADQEGLLLAAQKKRLQEILRWPTNRRAAPGPY